MRLLLPRNLCELAALEFLDEALGDCQVLDHVVVLCLIFSLHLVDYKLGIAEDLEVLCTHLVAECQPYN